MKRTSLLIALGFGVAGSAFSQTITDTTAGKQFLLNLTLPSGTGVNTAPSASTAFTGTFCPGTSSNFTTDGLFQMGYYLRANPDTSERNVNFQWVSSAASGNSMTVTYRNGVAGGGGSTGIELALKYTITGLNTVTGTNAQQMSGSAGFVKLEYTLKNFGTTARNIEFFPYIHFNPRDGIGTNQTSTLTKAGNTVEWASSGALNKLYFHSVEDPTNWQSNIYTSGTTGLRDILTNASSTTLNNTNGGAFVDNAFAYQFSFANVAGNGTDSRTGTLYYGYNTVPEPASMAALGLGALGLLRRRRASK